MHGMLSVSEQTVACGEPGCCGAIVVDVMCLIGCLDQERLQVRLAISHLTAWQNFGSLAASTLISAAEVLSTT